MRLVVCRAMDGWRHIARLASHGAEPLCLATDDPLVRDAAGKLPAVAKVIYIERMESLYCVAEDVKATIRSVNAWLAANGRVRGGIPTEVLYWLEHVEGGMTSQRVQDVLLLIRSYLDMLEASGAERVMLIWSRGAAWEDGVLTEVCRSRGVTVDVVGIEYFHRLADATAYVVKNLLLREPWAMTRALFSRWSGTRTSRSIKREILFQLGSSLPRHVDNVLPIMAELKRIGYEPLALCWTAPGAARRITQLGLCAENLEAYLGLWTLFGAYLRMWVTWLRLRTRRSTFLVGAVPHYLSVDIGKLLWPSICHFAMCELAQDHRYQAAISKYLRHHSPLAVKLWGGDAFKEGQALIRRLQPTTRPLLMFWFRGFTPDPYETDSGAIDLYLAAGMHQKNYLRSQGIDANRICMVGMSHYDALPEFTRSHCAADSRRTLGIGADYTLHVLFDLSVAYRGLLTPRELQAVMDFVGEFALSNPSVALIVKPHPGCSAQIIDYFRAKFAAPSVFVLQASIPPYHALNAADILICKCSTLGLEAMLFGRPVISVGLDNEPHFRIFDDAAAYAGSLADLAGILNGLLHDGPHRDVWVEEFAERGRRYMGEYLAVDPGRSSEMAAVAIQEALSSRRARASRGA